MPLALRNLHTVHDRGNYIFEQDVDIPLLTTKPSIESDPLLVRANVYRPKKKGHFPVLCTYGPYGKDIPYKDFHAKSFSEVNPAQKSEDSAWETPDPLFWTSHDYVVVRVDERGLGNSPGFLDTMSSGTCDAFVDVVEWAAVQPWSNGKVGLLGISYYAGSQWRVAARRPKGLAAIIPWEGMSDYYRDRVRHGGILSNAFISKLAESGKLIGRVLRVVQNSGTTDRSGATSMAFRVALRKIGDKTAKKVSYLLKSLPKIGPSNQ